MSQNGYLTAAELAPIPGGKLAVEPAAAWNAMLAEAKRRGLSLPMPDGPDSTYRSYARQVYWKQWWTQDGHPENAATPGTSHHGEGTAVDCNAANHNDTIRAIGQEFGWSKIWSDAPWEPWHHTYRPGIWKGKVSTNAAMKRGDRGADVWLMTHRLGVCGYLSHSGPFFSLHVEQAVRAFQAKHHLAVDGVVGPATATALKTTAAWCRSHGKKDV